MPHRFIRQNAVRNFILILIAVFSFRETVAQSTDQNYPVSASAFVAAQPNQNLSAYFSSSQALSVTLLLKDLTKPSLQVYLKWSMDGPGAPSRVCGCRVWRVMYRHLSLRFKEE